MIAFDTNVLTAILLGDERIVERVVAIPIRDQSVPVVVVEEIMRGRLSVVRKAEAGKAKISVDRAYELFQDTFTDLRRVQILPYTAEAESTYQQWRQQGIRVSTHDLRIAATCVVHEALLVTRNRRDFEQVPDLDVEFWDSSR